MAILERQEARSVNRAAIFDSVNGEVDISVEEVSDERRRELEGQEYSLWPVVLVWEGTKPRQETAWVFSKLHLDTHRALDAIAKLNSDWRSATRCHVGLPESPLPPLPGSLGR